MDSLSHTQEDGDEEEDRKKPTEQEMRKANQLLRNDIAHLSLSTTICRSLTREKDR